MKSPGKIALFPFPHADLAAGKLRPALIVAKVPGPHDDWLACMISSRLHQEISGFDEVIGEKESDYQDSGLKVPSLLRLGRLAVIEGELLVGGLGQISSQRLARIRKKLSDWVGGEKAADPSPAPA